MNRFLILIRVHTYFNMILALLIFKVEVLIVHILNNAEDVVDFDSTVLNIYTKHKISMIRV